MNLSKKGLATLGLIFITFLAAIQYVFLNNVPSSVSTFSFVCITNLIGVVVLFAVRAKKLLKIKKKTFLKGAFFAVLLTGFNVFVLIGSQGLDSVVTSSVVSLYFVFITPILLLLRKKINFFSNIATVLAIIALLLMFGGDTEALFSSKNVYFLVIADLFFASYVVGVSVLGANEDSSELTFSQMIFSSLIAFFGWLIEAKAGMTAISLPKDINFWISALFIGLFIRVVYGLLQISCQKEVSALSASLIFSTEIVITLIMDPFMSRLLGTRHTPATSYQVIGAVLLIISTLLADDVIMRRIGYSDMDRPSVSRKMTTTTLTFSMITLIVATVISISSIYIIRNSAVSGSTHLGEDASQISATAMTSALEKNIVSQAEDKALLAEQKLLAYASATEYAASYATSLLSSGDGYPKKDVEFAKEENSGKWTMQLLLEDSSVDEDAVKDRIELFGNMEEVFAPIIDEHENIATIYMGTEDGILISYDDHSELTAREGLRYYEFRSSPWYTLAMEGGKYAFTDAYWDGFGRGLTITCSSPFYDENNEFAGCVAMDILVSDLNASMVSDGIVDPTVATLIDKDGYVVASKDLDSLSEERLNIFDEEYNHFLKDVGKEILLKHDGMIKTGSGNEAVYVAYGTIDFTQWTLCIVSPVYTVIAPAEEIRSSIDTNTESVVNSVLQGVLRVIQNCLILTAVLLLGITLSTGFFSKRISNPLKILTEEVKEISGGNLDIRSSVSTDDEIGGLAQSFNQMTDSLQKYIEDLKNVTAREERIESELSVAKAIQVSMLPRNFDSFNKHREFEIFATMTAAKEVGGDFYDFFMADEDHLALVIADVSGKGVPAALFMTITKILIKTRAQSPNDLSPAAILEDVNNRLCEGNEIGYFVTVWLGIINVKTGEGLAANAGHEHPAIRRKDQKYELVIYKHSCAVATMEGLKFQEHGFKLNPGDSLYVYTDGVAEANNSSNELFGTDRMIEALNKEPDASPVKLLSNVMDKINDFVQDEPQFDDITMLALTYHGSGGRSDNGMDEIRVDARTDKLSEVMDYVNQKLDEADFPMKDRMKIEVSVEEIFVNIANYAYGEGKGDAFVKVETSEDNNKITITFRDMGAKFDPLENADPDVSLSAEERSIGGLGIYMVKKSMDEVSYKYENGQNILVMSKVKDN